MFKILLPVALVAAATSAFAAADGFYLNGNLGWDVAAYKNSSFDYMASSSIRRSGIAGGANFGYQINQNFAAEAGYTIFNRVIVNNIVLNTNPTGQTTLANGHLNVSAWDLAVKVMRPLNNGFGIHARVGVAAVRAVVGGGLNNSALGSSYKTHTQLAPEIGPGVTYDINNNVQAGLSLNHIFKVGNTPSITSAMANLAYHFG